MNPIPAPLKDPVCGMGVTDKSQHHIDHDGQSYYFCSAKCRDKFAAYPQRYKAPASAVGGDPKPVGAAPGTIYT